MRSTRQHEGKMIDDRLLATLEARVERLRQERPVRVAELMTRNVATCRSTDTAEHCARIMWERACGCVPVVDDGGQPISLITDRDICMAAYTQGQPLAKIVVSSAMSRRFVTVGEDDLLSTAEQAMRTHGVRRLIVIDEHRDLVGVLSIVDIVRDLYFGSTFVADPLSPEAIAGTAAALVHGRKPE
jgi:CBS domain-containing protein